MCYPVCHGAYKRYIADHQKNSGSSGFPISLSDRLIILRGKKSPTSNKLQNKLFMHYHNLCGVVKHTYKFEKAGKGGKVIFGRSKVTIALCMKMKIPEFSVSTRNLDTKV